VGGDANRFKRPLPGLPSIPASVQKGGFFAFFATKCSFRVINILLFTGLTCQARFAWLLFLKSNRLFGLVYSPDCLGFSASAPCEIVWESANLTLCSAMPCRLIGLFNGTTEDG
jgi:hypothetical protein